MDKAPEELKLRFKYIFERDYNPLYVNGAYGGVAPNGEIVIHFYHERHGLPLAETHVLTEAGLGDLVGQEPENLPVIRFVQAGVLMNSFTARILRSWLDLQIVASEDIERRRLAAAQPAEETHG